jgi:hypothetical protein
MTPGLEWLLIAWGIVTGVFLILLFYRSMLTRQEDDQLFLDESSSRLETEVGTNCQGEQNKSAGQIGGRNIGTDDFGYRGLGCLHWIELDSAVS